jgi:hypothetical protein
MVTEKLQEAGDIFSIGSIVGAAVELTPAVILIFTVPYLIYRALYWREKFKREKAERLNAEANINRSDDSQ